MKTFFLLLLLPLLGQASELKGRLQYLSKQNEILDIAASLKEAEGGKYILNYSDQILISEKIKIKRKYQRDHLYLTFKRPGHHLIMVGALYRGRTSVLYSGQLFIKQNQKYRKLGSFQLH